MIYPGLPDDPGALAAIGKIAVRHGQLDHALKMMVKDLAGVSREEALDAMAGVGSRQLRTHIKQLYERRFGRGDPLRVRLDALLTRARKATDKRNGLLHGVWAVELDGEAVQQNDEHAFENMPPVEELESVADELWAVAKELNFARLDGFLTQALRRWD
jgi:hypothetical protein